MTKVEYKIVMEFEDDIVDKSRLDQIKAHLDECIEDTLENNIHYEIFDEEIDGVDYTTSISINVIR